MDVDKVLALLKALQSEGVAYVLVGPVAWTIHGIVRATRDVDLFIRPDESNIVHFRAALASIFPEDASIQEISATDLAGDYPIIRYVSPDGSLVIDILSRLGEMFSYDTVQYEERMFAGVMVRVATPAVLDEMRKGPLHLQDHAEEQGLREAFEPQE